MSLKSRPRTVREVLQLYETVRPLWPDYLYGAERLKHTDAGWSSPVARQAHNLKVVGSNPTPAPNKPLISLRISGAFFVPSSVV